MKQRLTREEKYFLNHKIIDNITYKKCSKCNKWFPENTDNFYLMNKSIPERGYAGRCKKCSSQDRLEFRYQDKEHYERVRQQRLKSIKTGDRSKIHNEQTKEWIKQNKDVFKKYMKQYLQSNTDKTRMYTEKRKYKNHIIANSEWIACKKYFNNSCAYCGLPANNHYREYKGNLILNDLHREHVNHEGSRYLDNCVPACLHCNSSKWKHPMEEWYRQQEFFSEEKLQKIYDWIDKDYKQYVVNILTSND